MFWPSTRWSPCGRARLRVPLRKSTFQKINFLKTSRVSVYTRDDNNKNQVIELVLDQYWQVNAMQCFCFNVMIWFFSAESPFPANFMLALGHSMLVKEVLSNHELDPSSGVEASEIYPEVKYTTVDNYLNAFVWNLWNA